MLWREWYRVVSLLGKSCARRRTFLWLVSCLAMMSLPHDELGVAGLLRAGGLTERCYRGFLRLFHSSAVRLDTLTLLWVATTLQLFRPFRIAGHPVVVVDATKRPKEGRKMPGVKLLHQDSDCNTKRPFIMGHCFQTLALLVRTGTPRAWAVPLVARLSDGVRASPSEKRGLIDKAASLVLETIGLVFLGPVIVVADSFYASRSLLLPLLAAGHHVVSRLRANGVAYWPAAGFERRRGRKRKWGKKVKLSSLFAKDDAFQEVTIEREEARFTVRYRCLDLLWRPTRGLVRFVLVKYPDWPNAILMSSDTTMPPAAIIQCYAYRFRIELTFRAAIHAVHAFAYRFWLMGMKPWHFGGGAQYLHRETAEHRQAVYRKIQAYDLWAQLAAIAQGLLMHLAINLRNEVWGGYHRFMRTRRTDLPPSEMVTAAVLAATFDEFRTIVGRDEKKRQFFAAALGQWGAAGAGPPAATMPA